LKEAATDISAKTLPKIAVTVCGVDSKTFEAIRKALMRKWLLYSL
jgi:hypothetical protein